VLRLLTVNVAAFVVAVLQVLVKTARYWLPFCESVKLVKLSVVLVAPLTLLQEPPLLVLTCHCTVGDGVPLALAVKLALPLIVPVWFDGCVVTEGALLTVSVAALEVGVLQVS
jgi:hypothetical protein